MTTQMNFRTATTITAPARDVVEISRPSSDRRPTPTPKRPQRPWLIPVGVAAALGAIGIAVMVQNGGSESAQPAAPTVAISELDASRGPNVDLAPNLAATVEWAAPVVNRGPNADLAPGWAAGQTTAAPPVNAGPNADLARSMVSEAQSASATATQTGGSTGAAACATASNVGPNVDLPRDLTGLRSSGQDVSC